MKIALEQYPSAACPSWPLGAPPLPERLPLCQMCPASHLQLHLSALVGNRIETENLFGRRDDLVLQHLSIFKIKQETLSALRVMHITLSFVQSKSKTQELVCEWENSGRTDTRRLTVISPGEGGWGSRVAGCQTYS